MKKTFAVRSSVLLALLLMPLAASATSSVIHDFDADFTNLALVGFNVNTTNQDANGMLDSWEFAVLSAVLADTSKPAHNAVHAAWDANVAATSAAGTAVAGIYGAPIGNAVRDVLAAYVTCGDAGKVAYVQGAYTSLGLGALYAAASAAFDTSANSLLGTDGDADGDSLTNVTEYGAASDRADYVTRALTPEAPAALSISTQPVGANISVGGSHTFTVAATGGTTPYHYQWKRDATNVGTDSPSLAILSATLADSGSYTCVVTDSATPTAASVTSDAAVLNVSSTPLAFGSQPGNLTRVEGQTAILGVTVTGGVPPYHYQWKHDGTNVGTDSSTYTIGSVTLADGGEYVCVVTDSAAPTPASITSNTATLSVFPPGSVPALGMAGMVLLVSLCAVLGVFALRKAAKT